MTQNIPSAHKACGKGHRTPEAYEKCEARAEKRAARLEAKKADAERRWKNAEKLPVNELIRQEVRNSTQWERIVARLNRDYPPKPDETKWNIWDVVYIDSGNLIEMWQQDQETITLLRLQKHVLGDFVGGGSGVR